MISVDCIAAGKTAQRFAAVDLLKSGRLLQVRFLFSSLYSLNFDITSRLYSLFSKMLFYSHFMIVFSSPAATFNGSEYARGVWADKFVSSHSVNSATDNTKYTFDTGIHYLAIYRDLCLI
jgi:hypothetical protein